MIRDIHRYARQTKIRLILGGLLLIFLIGDGLVYLFYGRNAAVMGLLCMLVGLAPILLILLFLSALDWIIKREN